ncbi:3-oxoacyl-ACP synthase [Paraburkholderia tropica]|uniref:3-oxoacyl-ACP synthase n=1 Tax=Paraburkholderia tropica TaxID=92647 RepID=UPI0030189CD7
MRISATSRYIPRGRVRPQAQLRGAAGAPTSARDIVMQSIYADVLRWQSAANPTDVAGASFHPAAVQQVAIERNIALTDMALLAARQAVQRSSSGAKRTVDQIVVCATSLEQDLAMSCAGRLHSEFSSGRPPLAVGQLQGVGAFLAFQIANDMMAEDAELESILVVGAERWLSPFSRLAGSVAALGDGAAAAVVQRGSAAGWSIHSVTVRTPLTLPGRVETWIDDEALASVIDEACNSAGLSAHSARWIVPPCIAPGLVGAISARASLPADRTWCAGPDDIGYLCAADPLAQLDAFLGVVTPADGDRVLLWSTGLQGQAACAVLEYQAG